MREKATQTETQDDARLPFEEKLREKATQTETQDDARLPFEEGSREKATKTRRRMVRGCLLTKEYKIKYVRMLDGLND